MARLHDSLRLSSTPRASLRQRISRLTLLLVLMGSGIYMLQQMTGLMVAGADRYWVGTADGNWNDPSNWSESSGGASGATVPGSADKAIFDENGPGNCQLDTAVNVSGLLISSGYTGQVNQGVQEIQIGSKDFIVEGGTFNGGSGAISLDDSLSIKGGIFINTSDTLVVTGHVRITGGDFQHNSGTLEFAGPGNRKYIGMTPAPAFFDVLVNMGDGKILTIQSGDTLLVQNHANLQNGKLNTGKLAVEDTCQVQADWDNGSSELVFVGSDNAWLLLNNGDWDGNDVSIALDAVEDTAFLVDEDQNGMAEWGNTSKTLDIKSGALAFEDAKQFDLDFENLTIQSGGMLVGASGEIEFQGHYHNQGGTLVHNEGLFSFNGTGNRSFTCDVTPADRFYDVRMNLGDGKTLTITEGDTLLVAHQATLDNGKLNTGAFAIDDTCQINPGWDNGSATLVFVGNENTRLLLNDEDWSGNDVVVALSELTDTAFIEDLDGNGQALLGNTSKTLTVSNGALAFEGEVAVDLDFGNLNIEAGGELIGARQELSFQGDYHNQGGTFSHNQGLFTFNGSGNRTFTCDLAPADRFYDVRINMGDGRALTITGGDTLLVAHQATLDNGKLNTGAFAIDDTCQINPGWDNGSATLAFVGNDNAWLLLNDEDWSGNDVVVAMSTLSDTAIIEDLDGNGQALLGNSNQTLTVSNGALAFEEGVEVNLDFGNLNIEAGGELIGARQELVFQGHYHNQGGTFTHNQGRFTFDGTGNRTFTCDIAPTDQFYDLEINMGNSKALTVTGGDTLYVSHQAFLTNGKINTGTFAISDTLQVNSGWDNGNAELVFVGSDNAWFLLNGEDWSGNDVTINLDAPTDTAFFEDADGDGIALLGNSDKTLSIKGGRLAFEDNFQMDLDFGTLEIQSGGTLVGARQEILFQGNYHNMGGSFEHNQGQFTFNGSGNRTFTCDGGAADQFYDLQINMGNSKALTISTGDTLRVNNHATLTNGKLNSGIFAIADTCQIVSGWDDGSSQLTFVGSGNAWLLLNGDNWSGNNVVVAMESTSDTTFMYDVDGDGIASLGGSDYTLTLTNGILGFEAGIEADLNFGTLELEPNGILLGATGEISFQGNYHNKGGALHPNGGLFTFDGAGNRTVTMDGPAADRFHNLKVEMGNSKTLTINSGDTLYALNHATLSNGKLNSGVLVIDDTCRINAGWDNGNSSLVFVGSDNAWLLLNNDNWSGNDVSIAMNGPADTTFFYDADGNDTISMGNSSYTLTIAEGALGFQAGLTADLEYQDLLIESGGTLVGSSGELKVQGNLNNSGGRIGHNEGLITFDGSGNRSFTTSSSPVDTFFHVNLDGGNNKTFTINDTLFALGNLSLTDGKLSGSPLKVGGDVTVASHDGGTNSLLFVGNSRQNFDLTGNTARFNGDIVIMQSRADTVALMSELDMDASNQDLTLTKGYLVTTASNLLIVDDGRQVFGGSDSSFVSGPMLKRGNDAFTFPIGKDTAYAPLSITAPSGTSHAFTAEYFREAPSSPYDFAALEVTLREVSACEFWTLDRTNGNSKVDVTLTWDSPRSCEIQDVADLFLAGWDGSQWKSLGTDGGNGDRVEGDITNSLEISNYQAFTLGVNSNEVLPVSLLGFEVYQRDRGISIEWKTAREANSDYFQVERSVDGENWQDQGRVEAAGNSDIVLSYKSMDLNPPLGMVYYRLRQVDVDGTFALSGIRQIKVAENLRQGVSLYPNPVKDRLTVEGNRQFLDQVQVFDLRGTELTADISAQRAHNERLILDFSELKPGIYLVKTASGIEKVYKQ